jgi:hypothetical protein
MRNASMLMLLCLVTGCASTPAEKREMRARGQAQDQVKFEATLATACQGTIVIETNEVPHSKALSVLVADRLAQRGCRTTTERGSASHALRVVGFYESEAPWRGHHFIADLVELAWYQYAKAHGGHPAMTVGNVEEALQTPSLIAFAMRGSGVDPRHYTYEDVVAQPIVGEQIVTLHGILANAKDPDSQRPLASWSVKTVDDKGPQFAFLPRLERGLDRLLASRPVQGAIGR